MPIILAFYTDPLDVLTLKTFAVSSLGVITPTPIATKAIYADSWGDQYPIHLTRDTFMIPHLNADLEQLLTTWQVSQNGAIADEPLHELVLSDAEYNFSQPSKLNKNLVFCHQEMAEGPDQFKTYSVDDDGQIGFPALSSYVWPDPDNVPSPALVVNPTAALLYNAHDDEHLQFHRIDITAAGSILGIQASRLFKYWLSAAPQVIFRVSPSIAALRGTQTLGCKGRADIGCWWESENPEPPNPTVKIHFTCSKPKFLYSRLGENPEYFLVKSGLNPLIQFGLSNSERVVDPTHITTIQTESDGFHLAFEGQNLSHEFFAHPLYPPTPASLKTIYTYSLALDEYFTDKQPLEDDTTICQAACMVGANAMAEICNNDEGTETYLRTHALNLNGAIGSMLDSITILDASLSCASIQPITGNLFLISGYNNDTDEGILKTVQITPGGALGAGVLSTAVIADTAPWMLTTIPHPGAAPPQTLQIAGV